MQQLNRVLITGGGTGGHIFPAIAIANELKVRFPTISIEFVGAVGGMELSLVAKAGYTVHALPVQGIRRQFTLNNVWRNLAVPFKSVQAYLQANALVRSFQPDIVIGTGGYASFPVVFVAQCKRVPTFLNEQNAYPGLVNRILAKRATKVLLGNLAAAAYLPAARTVFTGNPVRSALNKGERERGYQLFNLTPDRPVLFVMGGSLGARTLNQAVLKGLLQLKEAGIQVLWQCGAIYYGNLIAAAEAYDTVHLMPFIDNMEHAYAAADMVICRAGALTLSEVIQLSKPAIVVPSPNVAADHQTKNAESLSKLGAAELVKDEDAAAMLIPRAIALLKNPTELLRLRIALESMPKLDATKMIVDEILAALK